MTSDRNPRGHGAVSAPSEPVLVVDDDPALRQTIRWTLEADGFPVVSAAGAAQAVEAAQRERPALVLLDYGLPDGDGSTVAQALRTHFLGNPPPIIVITADGRAAEKAARAGAAAYLHKPFDLDDLLGSIRRVLRGSPKS